MVVHTQNTSRRGAQGPGREPRVPAAEPPARLPDLRPRRRVPAAGPGDGVRARREPVRGGEAHVREADRRCRRSSTSTASAACCARAAPASATRSAATGSSSCSTGARASASRSPPGEDFRSPFSGNTVQICPVGALTADAVPVRRAAVRPVDRRLGLPALQRGLQRVASTCVAGEVVRDLARDNVDVNDAWLCDKGRFAFAHVDRPDRLTMPLLREHGLEPASFDEVFTASPSGRAAGASRSSPAGGSPTRTRTPCRSSRAWCSGPTTSTTAGRSTAAHGRALAAAVAARRDLRATSSARRRSSSSAWTPSRRCRSCTCGSARPRAAGAAVFVIHPRRTRLWDVAEHLLCLPEHQAYVLERIHDGDAPGGHVRGRASARAPRGRRRRRRPGRRAPRGAPARRRRRADRRPRGTEVASRSCRVAPATAGPCAPGCIRRCCPGGRRVTDEPNAPRSRARGAALPAEGRAFDPGDPRGVREPRDRRPVPGRRRPAPRHPGRGAGAPRALERAFTWWCSRSSSARWSRSPTRSCPRPRGSSGRARSPTGRAGRSRSDPVRPPPASRGPTGRSSPGSPRRSAGRSASRSLEGVRAEVAPLLEPRAVEPPARRRGPGPGARSGSGELTAALTYPLLVDEGRLLRGRGRAEGGARAGRRSSSCTPRTPTSAGSSDGGRATVPTDAGEAVARRPRHRATSPRARCSCRSTSPGSPPTRCSRVVHDGRHARAVARRPTAAATGRPRRRAPRGPPMDWLDWVLLVGAGRRRVLRAADHRDAR